MRDAHSKRKREAQQSCRLTRQLLPVALTSGYPMQSTWQCASQMSQSRIWSSLSADPHTMQVSFGAFALLDPAEAARDCSAPPSAAATA